MRTNRGLAVVGDFFLIFLAKKIHDDVVLPIYISYQEGFFFHARNIPIKSEFENTAKNRYAPPKFLTVFKP